MYKIIVVHDTKVRAPGDTREGLDGKIRRGLAELGVDCEMHGYRVYDPAKELIDHDPFDVDVAVLDQQIPLSEETFTAKSSDLGYNLAVYVAERSSKSGHKCLVLQYTEHSAARVSAGLESCPIYRYSGADQSLALVVKDWLEDRHLDADSLELLERGRKQWISQTLAASHRLVLDHVHSCRHSALSTYVAVNTDIQTLDELYDVSAPQRYGQSSVDELKVEVFDGLADSLEAVIHNSPKLGGLMECPVVLPDTPPLLDIPNMSGAVEEAECVESELTSVCQLMETVVVQKDWESLRVLTPRFQRGLQAFSSAFEHIIEICEDRLGETPAMQRGDV